MIDGTFTSPDWQAHPTDILVLPVGACEQHGTHLPLDTDAIQADFFGHMIAAGLDAALLPTIRIATSMEHTGFRGSFSLRPETLMQIVRDIADEAGRQGFRILVIANAHGGNHALVPVCRDINRRDGPLKILIVNVWEFPDSASQPARGQPGPDFHANAYETSIMLHIRPDLVRRPWLDADSTPRQRELVQADLTSFGVGHFSDSGVIGWPSGATPEQGRMLVESIRVRLLEHIRNRVERLRATWRYAGPGGLAIRPLSDGDLAACMRLKTAAGWNQVEADWRMLLAAAPDGCFAMVHQGQVVGSITTTPYGRTAWIGMLLVDPAFRGMGIGTRLMHRALTHLAGTPAILLDATDAGRPVYLKLGFTDEHRILRMTTSSVPSAAADLGHGVRGLTAADEDAVAAFDHVRFGGERRVILAALRRAAPQGAFVREHGGRITGYVLGRRGSDFQQVGPLVADSYADAHQLLQAALAPLAGRPAVVDVPARQDRLIADLLALGFSEQRGFTRMVLGAAPPGEPTSVFASGGPEIG
jgi:creatinine amidohydrolase/Fe(II)-dependent formamide hydrolase-like protein/predicted N-acetyltransferase YhbS